MKTRPLHDQKAATEMKKIKQGAQITPFFMRAALNGQKTLSQTAGRKLVLHSLEVGFSIPNSDHKLLMGLMRDAP